MALTAPGRATARRGRARRIAPILLLFAASPAAATDGLPTRTFDIRTDAQFRQVAVPLRTYLRQPANRRARGAQHFCVVGYIDDDGERSAKIHWREGHELIGWGGATDPASLPDSIRFSPDKLDLKRDVVAKEADIAGSTYLVTRAWVDKVLADCARKGVRYTIRR